MIKAIFDLAKIFLLIGLAAVLVGVSGKTHIDVQAYSIEVSTGVFLLCLLVIVALLLFLGRLFYDFMRLPSDIKMSIRSRRQSKGYQALITSIAASSAGDYAQAYHQAKRAYRLLPQEQTAIALLLKAQAADYLGHHRDSTASYQALLANKNSAFLGLKGLMNQSLDQGDQVQALLFAREALTQQPRQPLLIKAVYELELANRLWGDALIHLKAVHGTKVYGDVEYCQAMQVLYLILAQDAHGQGRFSEEMSGLKKAYALDVYFIPAAVMLAYAYIRRGKYLKARGIVKKIWCAHPHPDLLPVWEELFPSNTVKGDVGIAKLKWFEWVLSFQPENVDALCACAQAAMDAGLWGEARGFLERASLIRPTVKVYTLWSVLEERMSRHDSAKLYKEKALRAVSDAAWICAKTHRVFDRWVGVVEPEGYFNSLVWGFVPEKTVIASSAAGLIEKR